MVFKPNGLIGAAADRQKAILYAISDAARRIAGDVRLERLRAARQMFGRDQQLERCSCGDPVLAGHAEDLPGIALPIDLVAGQVPDIGRLVDGRENADEIQPFGFGQRIGLDAAGDLFDLNLRPTGAFSF